MAVKVLIPTPLQKLTDGKDVVEAPAGKIIDIINALDKQYPGLAESCLLYTSPSPRDS